MKILISDISEDTNYIATTAEDCRDKADLVAFELAIETGTTICLGKVVAYPIT